MIYWEPGREPPRSPRILFAGVARRGSPHRRARSTGGGLRALPQGGLPGGAPQVRGGAGAVPQPEDLLQRGAGAEPAGADGGGRRRVREVPGRGAGRGARAAPRRGGAAERAAPAGGVRAGRARGSGIGEPSTASRPARPRSAAPSPWIPGSHQLTARASGARHRARGQRGGGGGEVAQWQAPAGEPGATSPGPAALGTRGVARVCLAGATARHAARRQPPRRWPLAFPSRGRGHAQRGVIDSGAAQSESGLRRWWPWAAGAAAVVAAGVVTTVLLTRGGDDPGGSLGRADWRPRDF